MFIVTDTSLNLEIKKNIELIDLTSISYHNCRGCFFVG